MVVMYLRPKPHTVIALTAISALTVCFLPPALAKMRFGVTDANGRDVIPCKFKGVKYLGGGLYLAQEFDPANSASMSHHWRLFTRAGNEIKVALPKGYTLCDVYLPASSKSEPRMTALPAGTILKVHNKSYALCDLKQHLLLPQGRYERIESLDEDMFDVQALKGEPPDIVKMLFDARSKKLIDINKKELQWTFKGGTIAFHTYDIVQTSGLIDRTGKVLWEAPYNLQEQPKNGESLANFAGDLNTPPTELNSHTVLIDAHGKITAPDLDGFGAFTDGYAWAIKGDRQGIINRHFQFVTDTIYSTVAPFSNGLYGAQKQGSPHLCLLDKTGKEIFTLPKDAIKFDLMYANSPYIVCLLNAPQKHQIEAFYDKSGKEIWRGTTEELQNFQGTNKTPQQKKLQQLMNAWHAPGSDRIIKMEIDESFSPLEWREEGTKKGDGEYDLTTLNRSEMLNKLLANYDLIGMPKAKLEQLIGKPDCNEYYVLERGPCGRHWHGLEIIYAKGIVKRWRIVDSEHHGLWISTDAVWQESKNKLTGDYVPKHKK